MLYNYIPNKKLCEFYLILKKTKPIMDLNGIAKHIYLKTLSIFDISLSKIKYSK